jgi:putative exosortase-associated protein (TIGR04073 family)
MRLLLSRVLMLSLVTAPRAFAEPPPGMSTDAIPERGSTELASGLEKRLTKLGRGVANVALGWGEIALAYNTDVREGRSFAYVLGITPLIGTARAVARTGAGIVEIVTFPVPFPRGSRADGFDPIMEPEFVF